MEKISKQQMDDAQVQMGKSLESMHQSGDMFKTNLLKKAKLASEALTQKALAVASAKEAEVQVKTLQESLLRQQEKMESAISAATTKDAAKAVEDEMHPM